MVLLGAPLCLFTLFTTAVAQILTASLPGSKLDGLTVEASGQAFYIGGNGPATYCPTQVEPYCPNVTGTFFAGLGALYVRFSERFRQLQAEHWARSKFPADSKSTSERTAPWPSHKHILHTFHRALTMAASSVSPLSRPALRQLPSSPGRHLMNPLVIIFYDIYSGGTDYWNRGRLCVSRPTSQCSFRVPNLRQDSSL